MAKITKDIGVNGKPKIEIHRGKKQNARRVLLYGPCGVGKSTWAAGAWQPLFMCAENGVDDLDVASVPANGVYQNWPSFLADLQELTSNPKNYGFQTLVIDSLDWLEKIIWRDVCDEHGHKDISEFAYGKGYGIASHYWRQFIGCLEAARAQNVFIVLLAHHKIERFESPDTDAFDRYTINLHKLASAMIQEWADEVLFANFKAEVRESGDGIHKTKKGIGGRRYVLTTNKPTAVAKSRLNLPDEIDLNFAAYAECISK